MEDQSEVDETDLIYLPLLPTASPIKIINYSNDKFHIDGLKLSEIISRIDKSTENSEIAIVCVMGNQKSGKSLLTNIMLQNLNANGEGNWWGSITKKQEKLNGFPWNKDLKNEDIPSVDVWSRPFVQTKSNGGQVILLVLNLSNNFQNSRVEKAFEVLVWLLCSNVIINQLNNIDLSVLSSRNNILQSHSLQMNHQRIIFSVQNFIQSGIASGKLSDKKLEKCVRDEILLTLWGETESKAGFLFPPPGGITDDDGFLELQPNFIKIMKSFIESVTDEDEISCIPSTAYESAFDIFNNAVILANKYLASVRNDSLGNEGSNPETLPRALLDPDSSDQGDSLTAIDTNSNAKIEEENGDSSSHNLIVQGNSADIMVKENSATLDSITNSEDWVVIENNGAQDSSENSNAAKDEESHVTQCLQALTLNDQQSTVKSTEITNPVKENELPHVAEQPDDPQKSVHVQENKELQNIIKPELVTSSFNAETPPYFTIGTGNKERKSDMTTDEKQAVDEKVQKVVQGITEDFSNSVYHFMTEPNRETLSSNHPPNIPNALFSTAEEKLKHLCTDLKFSEDETKDKLKILKNRLDSESKKIITRLKRNPISNEDQKIRSSRSSSAKEKMSNTATTESICKLADKVSIEETIAELIAMYKSKINTFLQTPESDKESILKFHSHESIELLNQLCNFMQSQIANISDSEKIEHDFLEKLEEEFSKHVPLSEEELVEKSDVNLLVMEIVQNLIQSSEKNLNCYNEEMEKYLKVTFNIDDLRKAHNSFIQKHLSQEQLLAILPTPTQEELQIIRNHFQYILVNRLQYYEKVLENELLARDYLHKLVSSCSRGYQYDFVDALDKKIKKTGLSPASIHTIVMETNIELINHIAQTCCTKESLVGEMAMMLQVNTRDSINKISTLFENVCKEYGKEMKEKFKQEIPFSDENLEMVHYEAKNHVLEHFSRNIIFKQMDEVSNSALDFAKAWYSNINTAIQQSENNIAFAAIKIVSQFHREEMMKLLSTKSFTDRKLKELHNNLKLDCAKTFSKVFPFHQDTKTHGLKNYSRELAAEIDLLYEDYLKTNDRHREARMKSIKSVTSKLMEKFNLELTRQLGEKSVTDSAFGKIYSEESNKILTELKKKFDELLLSDSFHVYEKNMKQRMNVVKQEMTNSNVALRKEERERVDSKQESLRKDEETRGCCTPTFCVEFSPKIIRCGFYDKQEEFVVVKNDSGKVDIRNKITFLKTNEFILGDYSEEYQSGVVYENISLEDVVKKKEDEITPREINFSNGKLSLDLEVLCSLVLIRLKEMAEKIAEEKFSSLVISVPVWFTARQRLAFKSAARVAGFSENYLINETTAAAISYFKTQPEKTESSVLVVSPDSDMCNAAVYSFDDGSVKMKSSCGDRHIKSKSGFSRYIWTSEDFYVTVVKETMKSQKNLTNAVFLCEDKSIMKKFRQIQSLEIQVSCNDALKHLTLKGVGEYALKLKNKILDARTSIFGITRYNFLYDTDAEHNKQMVHKNEKENHKGNDQIFYAKTTGKFKMSLYEMSSNKTKFQYGDAEFQVKKNEKIQLKVKPNQEGTYDVLLTAGDTLIDIGFSNLSEQKISDYLAMIERCFKKDPVQEALKQSKSHLHSVAKDMQERFDKNTAKSEMIRELIKKDIETALELSENPAADLHALQNKIKTLEAIREKRYPKSQ